MGRGFASDPAIGAAFCRYIAMDEHGHGRTSRRSSRPSPASSPDWLERIAVGQRLQFPSHGRRAASLRAARRLRRARRRRRGLGDVGPHRRALRRRLRARAARAVPRPLPVADGRHAAHAARTRGTCGASWPSTASTCDARRGGRGQPDGSARHRARRACGAAGACWRPATSTRPGHSCARRCARTARRGCSPAHRSWRPSAWPSPPGCWAPTAVTGSADERARRTSPWRSRPATAPRPWPAASPPWGRAAGRRPRSSSRTRARARRRARSSPRRPACATSTVGATAWPARRTRRSPHCTRALVAVIDDDCVADREWLAVLERRLGEDGGLALVAAASSARSAGDRGHPSRPGRRRDAGSSAARRPWHVGSGNNFAVRREWFERVGGCDLRLGPGTPGTGRARHRPLLPPPAGGRPGALRAGGRRPPRARDARGPPGTPPAVRHGMGAMCTLLLLEGDLARSACSSRWLGLRGRVSSRHSPRAGGTPSARRRSCSPARSRGWATACGAAARRREDRPCRRAGVDLRLHRVPRRGGRLGPCLESVAWADEIVVCDLESSDGSQALARDHGARVIRHAPVPIVEPVRNVVADAATGKWVLAVDPDERVTPGLAAALRAIAQRDDVDAAVLPRMNYDFGYPASSPLQRYEPQLRMYRRSRSAGRPSPTPCRRWTRRASRALPARDELVLVHDRNRSIPEAIDASAGTRRRRPRDDRGRRGLHRPPDAGDARREAVPARGRQRARSATAFRASCAPGTRGVPLLRVGRPSGTSPAPPDGGRRPAAAAVRRVLHALDRIARVFRRS